MKRVAPVSAITYSLAKSVLRVARNSGHDEVEYLNQHGLLLTPEVERRIKLETLQFIEEQMGEWSVPQFLWRRHRVLEQTTQADLLICIRQWIQDHITSVREAK